jgi:hypothetical protein
MRVQALLRHVHPDTRRPGSAAPDQSVPSESGRHSRPAPPAR